VFFWKRIYHNFKMFRSPFVTTCGFSMMGRHPTQQCCGCAQLPGWHFWGPMDLGVVDQSRGHPDFSIFIDYFLGGHLKSLDYATPVDSAEDLVARISSRVCDILGIFKTVRQSLHRHCQLPSMY
jgi:hypothetical protein